MADFSITYSESWHRIADQTVSLRPDVVVRRQLFHGEKWYVLEDPINNQFFRLRPAAYEFVARLGGDRTIEQVWQQLFEAYPDEAPGQQEVIQLLARLYHANLLFYQLPADSTQLFERYRKRRNREMKSKMLSVMFARFPLFDPDTFLVQTLPLVRPLFGLGGVLVWFATVIWAGKLVLDNMDQLRVQTHGVLAPDNLFLLYTALVLIKTLHEFGHAYACRHFGGEVHAMGVMLMVFTPIPYMDASSSWSFRSQWQRLLVAAAGMIVEVFVAAIAVVVWANTGSGTIHALAYNMIFIASVSTVLFNINPLLRFDGYYMLCDLLNIPNLHQQCRAHLIYLFERYGFGCRRSVSPAINRKQAVLYTSFGLLSNVYRVVVFTGIIIVVADRFLILGLLMAVACVISFGVAPLVRFGHYLLSSQRLERQRLRASMVALAALTGVFLILYLIPMPNRFRAPGVLKAVEHTIVTCDVDGRLAEVVVPSGTTVAVGDVLLRFSNPELELQQQIIDAQFQRTLALRRQAVHANAVNLDVLERQLVAVTQQRQRIAEQLEALEVHATVAGLWSAPQAETYIGSWLHRGTQVGELINPDGFYFTAAVSQEQASEVFDGRIRQAEVRLAGQAGQVLPVSTRKVVATEQRWLPSVALGWAGGGDIAIDTNDSSGLLAAEPFYTVRTTVTPHPAVSLLHGLTGTIRFKLPPEPLLRQWLRKLSQMLQQRYGL